jgi:glutaredoxin
VNEQLIRIEADRTPKDPFALTLRQAQDRVRVADRSARAALHHLNADGGPAIASTTFAAAVLALLTLSTPSHALYKVVGPDGKITYTDVQPNPSKTGKVTPIGASSPTQNEVSLPLELRQPVARYPVTLFVTDACEPCNTGRQFLRQRGVPFNERNITTVEDVDALQRLTGGREAPALTIGAQTVRGLSQDVWTSYLDAAGYPRESRLPGNYQYPKAAPLTERRETSQAAVPQRDDTPPSTQGSPVAPRSPSSIRF